MSRHAEKNPEIRKPDVELPLFAEQNFYKFEQGVSSMRRPVSEKPLTNGEVVAGAADGQNSEPYSQPTEIVRAQETATKFESCLTAPLSANGESGDCRSLSGTGSPRDVARARRSDRGTSHAAARSVVNLGRTRDAILDILSSGPKTDEEIARIFQSWGKLKCSPSGLRSRRAELVELGFIKAAGIGKTQAKRACTIWKLK